MAHMEREFSSSISEASSSITPWQLHEERESLLTVLHLACTRAASLKQAVPASCIFPVKAWDALQVFSAFDQHQLGETIFWERPEQQQAFVSAGTVLCKESMGNTCFAEATTFWRMLSQQCVSYAAPGLVSAGPVLLGGFAFDPLSPRTQLWQKFPDGLLVLPSMLFHVRDKQASLTITTMVQPSGRPEALLEAITTLLEQVHHKIESTPSVSTAVPHRLTTQNFMKRTEWQQIVAHTVDRIRHGACEKVVLARGIEVISEERPLSVPSTLMRLRAQYPGTYIFAFQRGDRYFVGATPELLFASQDGQLHTMALAGSVPRGATAEEDQRLGIALLQSPKNRWEHKVVVANISAMLEPFCSQVCTAEAPRLLRLSNIQHLETPISARLLPDRCLLEVLERLHPTPAVGGLPRQSALEMIRSHEQLDRGWYAGPIGWLDMNGNGEFAVALRSALVDGKKATLFAGGGIVADSCPEDEYAETCWKFQVMVRGLSCTD